METNATKPARNSRVILLTAGALVAIVAVVYFSMFYPPVDSQDTQGTIGAAKKWHSEQITDQDVKLEGVQTGSETAMADASDATALKDKADYFANTAKGLGQRPEFNGTAVNNLAATATQLYNMSENIVGN